MCIEKEEMSGDILFIDEIIDTFREGVSIYLSSYQSLQRAVLNYGGKPLLIGRDHTFKP